MGLLAGALAFGIVVAAVCLVAVFTITLWNEALDEDPEA